MDRHVIFITFFRKQGLPTIFDYVPKFSIYEEQILSDNETTGLEDWFKVNFIFFKDKYLCGSVRILVFIQPL